MTTTGIQRGPMVLVSDLGHRFAGTGMLYQHVAFTVAAGQTLAVTGPSGSGKSTLLSLVAGWDRPTCGRVDLQQGARVCWVFQNPYGPNRRTVLDIAAFPLVAQEEPRSQAEEEARGVLDQFGLLGRARARFADLSGGEAQRLMLVRSICSRPDILLVDEPTAQLDMRSARQVADSLRLLAGRGMAVIIATHDPAVAQVCDVTLDLEDYLPEGGTGDEAG